MIARVINEKAYCGLDIGSQNIKASLLKASDPEKIEVLGILEKRTRGFDQGCVTDLKEFSECIQSVLTELIKKTGVKFKDVYLGVSGNILDVREVKTEIPLIDRGSKVIVERDIKRLNKQARLLSLKMEEEILHELPQMYAVDDVNSAINPLGLYGRKLGVCSSMVIAPSSQIQNIAKAVQQAGFDAVETLYSTCSSSDIVLGSAQKEEGCILVDVGAQITTLIVYGDNMIKHIARASFGGDDLTRSIAEKINVSFDMAEEIKKSYAGAVNSEIVSDEEILVKKDDQYIPVQKKDIYESINGEVVSLVEFIKSEIARGQVFLHCRHGIIMIGGGALLTGLLERIHERASLPVKLGSTGRFSFKNRQSSPKHLASVGLAYEGYKNSLRYSWSANGHSQWFKRFFSRASELYHEYF